jgi:hypothetical protein
MIIYVQFTLGNAFHASLFDVVLMRETHHIQSPILDAPAGTGAAPE